MQLVLDEELSFEYEKKNHMAVSGDKGFKLCQVTISHQISYEQSLCCEIKSEQSQMRYIIYHLKFNC